MRELRRRGFVVPLDALDEVFIDGVPGTPLRNRFIANFLAAFLTMGGVAEAQAPSTAGKPTQRAARATGDSAPSRCPRTPHTWAIRAITL